MNDRASGISVLDRYTAKTGEGERSEQEAIDDHGAFGWLRGVRDRSIMLELRLKDGSITSFSYAFLKKATFDPSEGISLDFSGESVRVRGRNLDAELAPRVQLFNGILRHRVTWIRQSDGAEELTAAPSAVVIEEIVVD